MIRRRKKLPSFTAIASAVVWKDGVDATKLPLGKPHPVSLVETYLDRRGRRWRAYDGETPVLLDTDTIVSTVRTK